MINVYKKISIADAERIAERFARNYVYSKLCTVFNSMLDLHGLNRLYINTEHILANYGLRNKCDDLSHSVCIFVVW